MKKFRLGLIALFLLLALVVQPVAAQRVLQTVDITDMIVSPLDPTHVEAPVVAMRHDQRCMPWTFSINDTYDPIPNPLGEDFLALDDAVEVFQHAIDLWNDIPTSYFEMQIDGTNSNPDPPGIDFVNEITFNNTGFTFAFFQPQSTLASYGVIELSEIHFVSSDLNMTDGLDVDGDGDADALAGLANCMDADGDGDIEFPAGLYEAGAIIDIDIQFGGFDDVNPLIGPVAGTRFTVDPGQIDDELRSVDLLAASVQAFGIVHAMAHSITNQPSLEDGLGAVMYPFIDTTDPIAELGRRNLDIDAVLNASTLYPEGSGDGLAAIQDGDVAFDDVFGWIRGSVFHGPLDHPATGASVAAIDRLTGRVVNNTYTGQRSRLEFSPEIGALLVPIDLAYNAPDGDYAMAVPHGLYDIMLEGVDAQPILPFPVNLSAQIGGFLGLSILAEEYYNGGGERANERSPSRSKSILVRAGEVVEGIDFISNITSDVAPHGFLLDSYSSTEAAPGTYYAVRIPAADFNAADPGPQGVAHSANFLTAPAKGSQIAVFDRAMVARGNVSADGSTATINLANPLRQATNFIGQEEDFTPLYFNRPAQFLRRARNATAAGSDLFLVIRLPQNGDEMPRIGIDGGIDENDAEIFGYSYYSTDGVNFVQETEVNYMFSLSLSEDPTVN